MNVIKSIVNYFQQDNLLQLEMFDNLLTYAIKHIILKNESTCSMKKQTQPFMFSFVGLDRYQSLGAEHVAGPI